MRSTFCALVLIGILLSASEVFAQSNELAVTVGGRFGVNQNYNVDTTFAIEGSYAGRLIHVPLAALYIELPVAAGLKGNVGLPIAILACIGCPQPSTKVSSLFVAPGLKLKLAPEFPVSPYFTVGGGVAHFSNGTSSSNSGTAQFGGGLDFKVAPFISFRGEVRDFYSGLPLEGIFGGTGRQHNIFTTAGIVLRF